MVDGPLRLACDEPVNIYSSLCSMQITSYVMSTVHLLFEDPSKIQLGKCMHLQIQ